MIEKNWGMMLLMAVVISGCAGNGIPPEEIKNYALVEGGRGNALGLFERSVNVLPGMHTFTTTTSCSYRDCPTITYRFQAEAGFRYVLRVDHTIVVSDRNDPYERIVDKLELAGGEYVTRKAKKEYVREEFNQLAKDIALKYERRKQNLPLIRKIGTKICKTQNEFIYIGFVENITDDKIQIRVADAVLAINHSVRPGGFSPSIIWDNPLNWDLCE